jgi:hypothetical protein
MVRYTVNRLEDPNFAHTDFLPGLGGTGTLQRRQDASFQLKSALSQRVVNDFRFEANRINFPLGFLAGCDCGPIVVQTLLALGLAEVDMTKMGVFN